MKLSDFKIGTRLSFGFGLLVLLSVLSALLALEELALVERNLDNIVGGNNVKVKLNNDLSEAGLRIAHGVAMAVLHHEPAQVQTEAQRIQSQRERYAQAWAALQKFPASESGKANRAKIASAAVEANLAVDSVLVAARNQKDAEALALLTEKVEPAAAKWHEALDENIRSQEANTATQHAQAVEDYNQARMVMMVAGAVNVALAVILAWIITRSIVRPMSRAIAEAERVAQGDLSTTMEVQGKDETAQLLAALDRMRGKLVQIVGGVRQNAEGVATASAQIAQGNNDLSQRTERQASALEQTAASMEQLGSTVERNADNARQANQLALGASAVAHKSGAIVTQVVQTMKGIDDSSKKISDIIRVIDGIAFQTNILALNAAVEAARAGEQGRGFAVVASEVRSLAKRSAGAAKEITTLIHASVERVERGNALADQAGSTMTEVIASIQRVADIMGEISAASTEQSAGVAQVGQAVTQLDQTTQQNAALVEESAAAAESLRGQARQLVQAVATFRLSESAQRA